MCALGVCSVGQDARADETKSRALSPPLAFDPKGEDWEGLSELVRLAREALGPQRVVVTPVLPLGKLERDDALLIVHPTRALDVDELETFMRAGGRVVLLDDYGTGDELLSRFHILRVPMPDRPARMLRDKPVFAIAEPASEHPVLHDVAHVVTNHATGLEQPALQRLLVVSGDDEPDVTLAVAGQVDRGRLVAVGDGSIVINGMMRFPGNRALAAGLVHYAAGGDPPDERRGKLYLLTNDFEMTGSFGNDSTLASAVGDARRLALGALETLRRDGMPPPVAFVIAVCVGLGILAYTMARSGRTYRPTLLRFVRPIPVSTQGGFAGRAAALGQPRAPRAQAVIELKRALEEAVAVRMPIEMALPAARLVDTARQLDLLGPDELGELGRLLGELRQMESAVGDSNPERAWRPARRVRLARVVDLSTRVQAMLRALAKKGDERSGGPPREPQGP
jgi:hypothetical protein